MVSDMNSEEMIIEIGDARNALLRASNAADTSLGTRFRLFGHMGMTKWLEESRIEAVGLDAEWKDLSHVYLKMGNQNGK